jgi:hypothetical protein
MVGLTCRSPIIQGGAAAPPYQMQSDLRKAPGENAFTLRIKGLLA